MTEITDDKQSSSLLRFFSRPVVGIAGSIASIIGIILSLYFFVASREKPELTYFVHPAKAAVVRTGQTSRLSVKFDGQDLMSDVTAAQVAFWNAGSKPIRTNTILSPLVIRTANKGRILEAKLRKTSRDVTQIVLDSSRLGAGEVNIGWNILEQNDGGVLQIVYAGDETVDIQVQAVLEGQPEITKLKYGAELRTPSDEYARRRGIWAQLPNYLIIAMSAALIPFQIWFLIRRHRRGQKLRSLDWVMSLQITVMFGLGITAWLAQRPPEPPFGF